MERIKSKMLVKDGRNQRKVVYNTAQVVGREQHNKEERQIKHTTCAPGSLVFLAIHACNKIF